MKILNNSLDLWFVYGSKSIQECNNIIVKYINRIQTEGQHWFIWFNNHSLIVLHTI